MPTRRVSFLFSLLIVLVYLKIWIGIGITTLSSSSSSSRVESIEKKYKTPSIDKWLNDISPNVIGCGFAKCAFQSLSNPDDYGYLATTAVHHLNRTTVHHPNRTFSLAERLSSRFSIHHGLLAPPQQFLLSTSSCYKKNTTRMEECMEWLRPIPAYSRLRRMNSEQRYDWFHATNTSVLVQPIELYQKGGMLFKCTTFVNMRNHRAAKANFSDDIDPSSFEQILRIDLNKTIRMMKEFQCLYTDFQLYIDTAATGRIYHIDLDRCFENSKSKPKSKPWNEECKASLEGIVEYLIEKKKENYNNSSRVSSSSSAVAKPEDTKDNFQGLGSNHSR